MIAPLPRLDGLALLHAAVGTDLDERRLVRAVARFWARVEAMPDGCWLWRAGLQSAGYGKVRIGPRWLLAHRVALLLDGQALRADREIDHLCRVRRCVRPSHLEEVPRAINAQRGLAAGQAHCRRGHALVQPNLYISQGKRRCRQCQLLSVQARYARRANEVSA